MAAGPGTAPLPKGEVTHAQADKIAVVTGAARGIGREIALLMARNGAPSWSTTTAARPTAPAPRPRPPTRSSGRSRRSAAGRREPRVGRQHEGRAEIVQTALDHFGRVDIVVNNAGILRDRMIFNMTEEEWDGVIDTHLKGAFAVTRAAAPHMREQKWGRIINMTSTSGLVGNVGQANYAAAKLGIVGFTKVVALDMARYNVTANCISPFAWTRMIGTIPTETEAQKARVEKIKKMGPEHIAPVAVFLASEAAKEISGQVFGVRGKEIMLFNHMRPVAEHPRRPRLDAGAARRDVPRHAPPPSGSAGDLGAVLQLRPAGVSRGGTGRARDEQQAREDGDADPIHSAEPGRVRQLDDGRRPAGARTSSIPSRRGGLPAAGRRRGRAKAANTRSRWRPRRSTADDRGVERQR